VRTTTYSETWVPFLGRIINCASRNATEHEKKLIIKITNKKIYGTYCDKA
jgi:hypothetical protein